MLLVMIGSAVFGLLVYCAPLILMLFVHGFPGLGVPTSARVRRGSLEVAFNEGRGKPTPEAIALVVPSRLYQGETGSLHGILSYGGIFLKDSPSGRHSPEVVSLAFRPGAPWPVVPVKEWYAWKEETHRHITTAVMCHLSDDTIRALKAGKLRIAVAYSYGSQDPRSWIWSALPLSR